MKRRNVWLVVPGIAGMLAVCYYAIEPWAVTFFDDGPYFSSEYSGTLELLPIQSQVDLQRFGRPVFYLESRLLSDQDRSVLTLKDANGEILWARLPVKPNGELGPLDLRRVSMTWYGGWRIAIAPAHQEAGYLYLGNSGSFRFFNHSW